MTLGRNEIESALIKAVFGGDKQFVQNTLARFPAALNATVPQTGDSLLHIAARQSHLELAEVLIKYGLKIDICDNAGRTPIYRAIVFCHTPMLIYLLKQGANPNHKSKVHETPLQAAASHANAEIAAILLDAGADVSVKNLMGQTVAEIAKSSGKQEMYQFLLIVINHTNKRVQPLQHVLLLKAFREITQEKEQSKQSKTLQPNIFGLAASANTKLSFAYKKVYIAFLETFTHYTSLDYDWWTGNQTSESRQLYNDIESLVLSLLEPYFRDGWALDGTFRTAIQYDTESKTEFFGLGSPIYTYKGFWANLRAIQTR